MKQVKKNTPYNVLAMLLTFSFLFWSGLAAASCSQADLKGIWRFTGVSGDTFYGEMNELDTCKLKLSSSGYVIASSSSCVFRDASGKQSFPPVAGGRLVVKSGCAVTGSIDFLGGGRVVVDSGSGMDRGKTVISLAGYANTDPDIVVAWTGVKK